MNYYQNTIATLFAYRIVSGKAQQHEFHFMNKYLALEMLDGPSSTQFGALAMPQLGLETLVRSIDNPEIEETLAAHYKLLVVDEGSSVSSGESSEEEAAEAEGDDSDL